MWILWSLDMNFWVPGKDHELDFATMFRNDQYKLVVYHNLEVWRVCWFKKKRIRMKFNNLWENTEYAECKNEVLMKGQPFDANRLKPLTWVPKRIKADFNYSIRWIVLH